MKYDGPRVHYRAVPLTLAEANAYVATVHRHNGEIPMARIVVGGVDEDGILRGVALAMRPVARGLGHPMTLEVARVCTDGAPNLCSFLYARIVRAAKELGYARLVTYTLTEEDGASLKAAGWVMVSDGQRRAERGGSRIRDWTERGREPSKFPGPRNRWEISLSEPIEWRWPEGILPEPEPSLFDLLGAEP